MEATSKWIKRFQGLIPHSLQPSLFFKDRSPFPPGFLRVCMKRSGSLERMELEVTPVGTPSAASPGATSRRWGTWQPRRRRRSAAPGSGSGDALIRSRDPELSRKPSEAQGEKAAGLEKNDG